MRFIAKQKTCLVDKKRRKSSTTGFDATKLLIGNIAIDEYLIEQYTSSFHRHLC